MSYIELEHSCIVMTQAHAVDWLWRALLAAREQEDKARRAVDAEIEEDADHVQHKTFSARVRRLFGIKPISREKALAIVKRTRAQSWGLTDGELRWRSCRDRRESIGGSLIAATCANGGSVHLSFDVANIARLCAKPGASS